MACGLSRVWCRDIAPLCNREGQAPWAPSPDLIFLDGPLARAEPAAGSLQHFGSLSSLENNTARSRPERETVPGIGPGRAAELACR